MTSYWYIKENYYIHLVGNSFVYISIINCLRGKGNWHNNERKFSTWSKFAEIAWQTLLCSPVQRAIQFVRVSRVAQKRKRRKWSCRKQGISSIDPQVNTLFAYFLFVSIYTHSHVYELRKFRCFSLQTVCWPCIYSSSCVVYLALP